MARIITPLNEISVRTPAWVEENHILYFVFPSNLTLLFITKFAFVGKYK